LQGASRNAALSDSAKRWLVISLIGGMLLGFGHKIERLGYQSYLKDQELTATIEMINLRERIEGEVMSRVLSVSELAAVISANPTITQDEYARRTASLLANNPDIISIVAAPDLVVTLVSPVAGNEKVIGLNYRENADQWPQVQAAMRNSDGLMTGPVDLVQGGRGLILRKPVMLDSADATGAPQIWGILSMVINFDAFLKNLKISQVDERYDILIREVSEGAATGQIMLGDVSLLEDMPIMIDFRFPFGHWQLAAVTEGGWPTQRPNFEGRWIFRISMIAILMVGMRLIMQLAQKHKIAETRLSNGIEALDHAFVMFGTNGKIVLHNSRYAQMHEMSETTLANATYRDLVSDSVHKGLVPEAIGNEKQWVEDWIDGQSFGHYVTEQHLSDGRIIRTSDKRMTDGSIVGLRIDVSDLKNAQLAAEAANRAKTDFMGVLSHELRTPLTVILGQVRLARNINRLPAPQSLEKAIKAHPEIEAEMTPLVEGVWAQIGMMMNMAERSGNHLMTLINEVLDFAKIDSGNLTVDLQPVEVATLVATTVDQLRPLVENKGLSFNIDVQDAQIEADAKRIQQVLINLISNATKFTEEGEVGLRVEALPKVVTFTVYDTGIGIPESEVQQVFEPFHQVDSSASRRHNGTGLGLAISRDIAIAHGGSINLKSEIGKGSAFQLTLPRLDIADVPTGGRASLAAG